MIDRPEIEEARLYDQYSCIAMKRVLDEDSALDGDDFYGVAVDVFDITDAMMAERAKRISKSNEGGK